MKQIVWIINCYLYGATLILLAVLALLVYLHGQANHLPNPFARRNIVYRPKEKAQGVLLGKKFGLMAYSPEQDEGHILVMGPSGTGKTSALLIPTLRSWQGTALVVDISGDISANVHAWFASVATGASLSMLNISRTDFENLVIPVPPREEQDFIADFLDRKCSMTNDIILDKKHQLEVLDLYKKSLIYEYITGKKEVPAQN